MLTGMSLAELRKRVPDLRQLASVRRIELDDGPERGVRALAFNTGGGLDFWILTDRAMDIGPLNWRGQPIAWQSATGFRSAALTNLEAPDGWGFMRAFSGMLVTCGLEHIGMATPEHPLHGRVPYTPARLLAYGEDWEREQPILFCEGEIDQVRHLGEVLRLRRRIEADIGTASLRIIDRVTNLGAEPQRHQMLYHINIGWPALDAGSVVSLEGAPLTEPFAPFPDGGARWTVSFPAHERPMARSALSLPRLGARLNVAFSTETLPFLQIWRDPRPQHHVLALEPCTSRKDETGANSPPVTLAPGESRDYRVELSLEGV